MTTELKVELLNEHAKPPVRSSEHAAGYDIHCDANFTIQPGQQLLVSTGVKMEIPSGFYGQILPRSGLAVKHRIDTRAGVIDSDYRGEVKVVLVNEGDQAVDFNAQDRICQMVIIPHFSGPVVVQNLNITTRGEGGFGSTGQN
jgi:dUTP pyrophosphatase